mmetsp:Transcript_20713/g.31752  ORF Transcript_20713/g.31752 Transcript_20713/m.31752 type:complete len:131 (-) Transcript_20713:3441-3833(-)
MQLDHTKSKFIINHLNSIRVWPSGIHGIIKRIRFVLRIKVKSGIFDNSMTFAVLLNTITLSVQHYGQTQEMTDILNLFNNWFTWIFIYEMISKLLAIGFAKYSADKMNYLDGGVVLLSVFEMVVEAVLEG